MRAFRSPASISLDGYSAEWIAETIRVHVTTARRYKRGEEPPYGSMKFLELKISGDLGVIDPAWSGWILRAGKLFPPGQDRGFTPGEIMATEYWRALARSYQVAMRNPLQGDWVSERWETPDEIEAG